jgi:hypothetical protein
MNDEYYKELLLNNLEQLIELKKQQDAIEVKILKLEDFVRVTANMISGEDERQKILAKFEEAQQTATIRQAGLTEAIRRILLEENNADRYLTVAEIRDRLAARGFDFSGYVSNPLASVSTTLKRMTSGDVEATEIQGVTAYRFRKARRRPSIGRRILRGDK